MNKTNLVDIGEIIEYSGLPASAIRYYEEKGLIQSIGRKGMRRQFDRDIFNRLDLIALGRRANFTLDEIGEMLFSNGPEIDREKVLLKADEINNDIKYLTLLRDRLIGVAECPEENHFNCTKFQSMVRLIRKSDIEKRNTK